MLRVSAKGVLAPALNSTASAEAEQLPVSTANDVAKAGEAADEVVSPLASGSAGGMSGSTEGATTSPAGRAREQTTRHSARRSHQSFSWIGEGVGADDDTVFYEGFKMYVQRVASVLRGLRDK